MRRVVLFSATLLIGISAVALGFWQLRRLAARRAVNATAIAGRALPALRWDSVRPWPLAPNRRAELTGRLDESREFLLRNRLVAGIPAVLVVTPLRLDGSDTAVLINRGYVPSPDAVDPGSASWSEGERRHFAGVLLPIPARRDGDPITHRGRETWRGLDLAPMRARLPYPLAAVYLVAQEDSGTTAHTIRGVAYPFRAELPPTDEGPHLMYAIQWFGIAAAVLAFGFLFVLKKPSTGNLIS